MPSRLTRGEFAQSLTDKAIDVDDAQQDPALAGLNVKKADLNADGVIAGTTEANALFKEIDQYDRNGDAASIALTQTNGQPTQAARYATAAAQRAIYETDAPVTRTVTDAALKTAFSSADALPAARGLRGDRAVALQYGLSRLGFALGNVDGQFGPATERAVRAFQVTAQLPQTGIVDHATLLALDHRLATTELRTPAEVSGNALAYLSNHAALGLPTLAPLADRTRPANWAHPEMQQRYGDFQLAFWEHCKTNRLEADCKTLSLFLMDQFRIKVKADLNVDLPRPAGLPLASWVAAVSSDTKGFFSRFEALPQIRPGYERAQAVLKLDPKASMMTGVNVRYAGVDANIASRSVRVSVPWSTARDNAGDAARPEIPVNQLTPGDIIFIDHTGDGRVDHMANVLSLERNAQGQVTSMKMATGSFDDMKDTLASTAPNGLHEVNNYCEEVKVDFDANGRVTASTVTWSSEPAWMSDGRYSARNLLMELRPGGTISVGRWAQPA